MVGSWRFSFVLAAFLGLSSTVLADNDPTDDLRVINISSGDVGALNRAVSDPANVNTVLVLAPGVYNLGPNSQDARNGGRLELQENQFISGTNRYLIRKGTPVPRDPEGRQYADPATETILDCSLVSAPGSTGCVGIWRGGTSRVTIRNGASAGALVHVGIAARPSGHSAVLFRTDLVGGQRAFRLQHNTAGHAGVASTAVISQSILRDSVGSFAFGWQVQIAGAAAGASVDVLVKNTTITRTRFGGFVAGLGSGATFTVRSEHNLYQENHAGLELDPARDAVVLVGTSPGFTGNTLDFTTESDRFVNNGPFSNSLSPTYWPTVGAISAKTAFRTGPMAGQHSNNTMRLTVKDPFFLGNSPADLLAYGAVSLNGGFPQGFPATELAGVNNVLELSIEAERGGNFIYCHSIPADSAGTNRVISDARGLVENCSPL